ncbi:MAG: T9SS type A sorting domain-containing protein [Chitinophagales bacterium]|nr:T9SS type A sorting domain-containing protein [Chitinophagaceae bacterium]MCB9065982.1 T9SS type A sorting domain-containing protein [Chitinophagales bacterium]
MKYYISLFAVLLICVGSSAQLTNGLIAHWPFSGNVNDISGNAYNGTAYNISYTSGKQGAANTAAVFNGTNSYVDVAYQSGLNTSKFTICAVIKPTGYYTGTCQVNAVLRRGVQYQAGSYAMDFWDNPFDNSCNVVDTSKNVFGVYAGTVTISSSNSVWRYSPTIETQKWYCVIATYDDTTFRMYVDGVLKHSIPKIGGGTGTSTNGLAIGSYRFGTGPTLYPYWLNGVVDDIRLYNRALTPTEAMNYCGLFDTSVYISQSFIKNVFCGDDTVQLKYGVTDNFSAGNMFTAELSDAAGSFASPTNIGSVTSTTAGTIVCTVPSGLTPSSNYRVRIVSTLPVRTSDVSHTITAHQTLTPSVSISATPTGPVPQNTFITFKATPNDAGTSPTYQWFRNGQLITGLNTDTWIVNTLNDGDSVYAVVYSSNLCPPDLSANSNTIAVEIISSVYELKLNNLSLYPNPNTGTFTLNATGVQNDKLNLDIFNMMGQSVYSNTTQPKSGQLNTNIELKGVPSGMYMLRITADGKQRNVMFNIR